MKKGKFKIQRVHIIAAVAVVVLGTVAMVMSQGSIFSGMLVSPIKVKAPITKPLPTIPAPIVPTTPATPTMSAPANGGKLDYASIKSSGSLDFKWNAVSGAVKYDLVLQQNNSKTDSTFHSYPTETTGYKMPASSLQAGGFYMWFVRAYNSDGKVSANPSNYWTFTISQESVPSQCTSFTYSDWGTCVNGSQSRSVVSSSPSGCTGGNPVTVQTCGTQSSTISVNKATPSMSLPVSLDTVLLDLNLASMGGNSKFGNNGIGAPPSANINIGSLPVNAANQLVVKLDSNSTPSPSSCYLLKISGGEQVLSTVTTIPSTSQYLGFNFNLGDLVVDKDTTARIQVRCDTYSMVPSTSNPSNPFVVVASVESNPLSIEWHDGINSDVTGKGTSIIPVTIDGNKAYTP